MARIPAHMRRDDPELAARAAKALEQVHHFTTTIYKNGGYLTARFETLDEARAHQPVIEAEAANHRKALVYAVTSGGMTEMIPDWYRPL